jgi:hypothetical protein
MSHHSEHRTQNWSVWRSLLYLGTVAIALVLNRTTSLGMVGAIGLGFIIAAALLWTAHLAIHGRDQRGPGPG